MIHWQSCFLLGLILSLSVRGLAGSVDYQREVRQILSRHCYQCHGPDQEARKAKLRLDIPAGAIVELGGKAISRVNPDQSVLLERIWSDDPDEQMPPPEVNRPLSARQREMLSQWVKEGAQWGEHWAYQPVVRPDLKNGEGGINPIDHFVRMRLEQEGIDAARPADPISLIRRVYFDLVGLPPDPSEVEAFISDERSGAFEHLVDRLLSSPHYGERMAMYWFDLVRYANTTGIHADNVWHVTPYRNWVMDALNRNMPFDQFTREQLAGDLLPTATLKNRIAATYNRLNLSTREGGSQPKEFIAKYMVDRVKNASSVWLAATMGCAECHEHKFDPITTKEFYQFGAFFADIEQVGVYGNDFPPYLKLPRGDQSERLAALETSIKVLESTIAAPNPELILAQGRWENEVAKNLDILPVWGEWRTVGPFHAGGKLTVHEQNFGPEKDSNGGSLYGDEKIGWEARPDWNDAAIHSLPGNNAATYLFREIQAGHQRKLKIWLGSSDGIRVWFNGKQVFDQSTERVVASDQDTIDVELSEGANTLLVKISNGTGKGGFFFRARSELVPDRIQKLLLKLVENRDESEASQLKNYFRSQTPLLSEERVELASQKDQRQELDGRIERTLATVSVAPAITRVLPRGDWMDESGEVVSPGVPAAMGGVSIPGRERQTRLDLANWLVDGKNPLTARVFVNRLWMLFFGTGLVASVDDFGVQGEMPSHPQLLDWLAAEFMESGWNMKHMVRLIVRSDAYKQSSERRLELESIDPSNRLVSRQNRYRLDAEMVRDMALSTSGLLNFKVGGYNSSRPYQPAGYYRHLNFPKRTYESDENEGQYRRGVYMHWQRQYLHPALKAFDAPTREECVARRSRSNTPLAALVQMNDPAIIEASRVLAERTLLSGGEDALSRLSWCFREVLSRYPSERELAVLTELLAEQVDEFSSNKAAAKRFLEIGLRERREDLDLVELASWTMLTRSLLNLHEAILRP